MTRYLDPDYEDRARRHSKTRVTFVDFSTIGTPDPSTARLVRVVEGFVDKVDFGTDLSDLLDFSFVNTSPTLVPGSGVRLTPTVCPTCPAPQAANCELAATYHWPSGIDVSRRLTQYKVLRETVAASTPSAMPSVHARYGSVDDVWVRRLVNPLGSTYPTSENQDSDSSGGGFDFSQHLNDHPMILDLSGRRGLVGYVYPDTSFLNFGAMSLGTIAPGASTASTVKGRLWRHPDNHGGPSAPCGGCACGDPLPCKAQVNYCGSLMWEGMAVMASDTVCVMNMPKGVGFGIDGLGVFPIMDSGAKAGIGSGIHPYGGPDLGNFFATVEGQTMETYANGIAYPFERIFLRDPSGAGWNAVSLTPTGPDGVWGGDCYRIEYDQPLDFLIGFSDSNVPGLQPFNDGRSYIGLGRQGLEHQPIQEETDLRAQAVQVSLPAIDLDSAASVVAALRDTRHRGGVMRVWAVHYDNDTGERISEPQLLSYCYTHAGFEIDWQPPSRTEEGDPVPGGARITGRPTSRIAGLDRRTGITMSTEGVQTYHPGETCYDGRKDLIGKEIPWGQDT